VDRRPAGQVEAHVAIHLLGGAGVHRVQAAKGQQGTRHQRLNGTNSHGCLLVVAAVKRRKWSQSEPERASTRRETVRNCLVCPGFDQDEGGAGSAGAGWRECRRMTQTIATITSTGSSRWTSAAPSASTTAPPAKRNPKPIAPASKTPAPMKR